MNHNRNLLLGATACVGAGVAAWAWRKSQRADVSGQVVLITGGSRGLGLAMALEFARAGCRIAICARDEDELDRAREIVAKSGSAVLAVPCDVSRPDQVEHLVETVRSRFGAVDILVNNAGQILVAPVENTTVADFERAMDVMFWGVLHPTLVVLPEMKRRGYGRIATITSIGGKVSVPHLLPYSCAKFAAVGFCEGLRAEMAPHGVHVTTIAPGLMRTGSHTKAEFKGRKQDEARWFSLAATLPLISMDAERAAAQIVDSIRRGESEKILTTQASLLARVNGLFPGFIPDLMSIANRLLPEATGDRHSKSTGAQLEPDQSNLLRSLTALGRKAGRRLNQGAV
ncbi:MAG TPA: SDR family NAD(P)-dependent oxidoreductase [Bryobacteraceae bacterium]|nr:SDR family NAD(P)-dependent oxidoreductase [Bryobacteraceae bacterium]